METPHFDLDKTLMDISSDDHSAAWTVRNAVEGLQIFGGIGSGKTSGSGKYFALKYLSNGFGGLVLTAKHDEKALWQEYCRLAGRSNDLIIVEPGSGYHFNFLEYESGIASGHKSFTLNIVELLKTVINAGKENIGRGREDSFWEGALDMLLGNIIDLCLLAYGKVTIQMLYDIAQSAPRRLPANAKPNVSPNEQPKSNEDPNAKPKAEPDNASKPFNRAYKIAMENATAQANKWKASQPTDTYSLKTNAELTKLAAEVLPDVRVMGFIRNFFTNSFLNLADKTRSIIDFNLIGFLYNLLREPTYSLFCRHPSNFKPEDCLQGKIILLNLPVKDYHKMGKDTQVMFKYIWQRAMERRRVSENGRPVFLWADEAQHFLHEHDAAYQATARSSRIATVYISQNLPNYFANMGGEASQFKVKSFLGTLGTKIFHANADVETNKYASELIGEAYQVEESESRSSDTGKVTVTVNTSSKLVKMVRPEAFGSLKMGGPKNDYKVSAYIHVQGLTFANGFNYQKIILDQQNNKTINR